jgi:hypothetical protein
MATQVKHAFVVTSAINSKFGVYNSAQRLEQTLATITSCRTRAPGSKIILMECAGTPLLPDQEAQLDTAVDVLINFSEDPDVKAIYASDNWDVVKNTTEIMCFARTLEMCWNDGDFEGIDRIHKMSGRYLLNDDFDLSLYEQRADRILIGPRHQSQFPFAVTGIELQYMARLWSWPATMTPEVIDVYNNSLSYIAERVAMGGYADIEHVLYKFLPPNLVTEVPLLGVEGSIAPNGQAIKN